jgi:hypothetical protein
LYNETFSPIENELEILHNYQEIEAAAKSGAFVSVVMDTQICQWEGGTEPDFEEVRLGTRFGRLKKKPSTTY